MELHYQEARRGALREYREAKARGESPYPLHLDEVIPSAKSSSGQSLGLEQIPLALIIGTKTAARTNAFARNFLPLLDGKSEFAAKWVSLCEAHLSEGIREPVKVYEYRNRFYVEEGNKRVSVLKYFDADSITAQVIRIPGAKDGSREGEMYDAFLPFYRCSGLRTVEFSRRESYARLQELMGLAPDQVWTEEERRDFESLYYYFHKYYVARGGDGRLPGVCDALLVLLERCGYETLRDMAPEELKERVAEVWPQMSVPKAKAVLDATEAAAKATGAAAKAIGHMVPEIIKKKI